MANIKTVTGTQYYLMKRMFLQQEGSDKSQRHLKHRDKYLPFVKRSRFRFDRNPYPDKGVVRWGLWITNKHTGKKLRGVEVIIPLGKICSEGWSFVAQEIRNAKKELRNAKSK